ncbi:tetratricopeptide repeat protein [Fuerstiella marisgermanici]|uniref:Putative PEP-CTERM system TPR-repeat lipoprotein n=1 Tax=Fuerstiella marisgermanici TaxID=1891926 RepID=A0A1P8WL81_9PLAN|nr:tetratricopeptide repeat protein [Fuerstiella marisgermanici]APZ94820.1 putative PEP-CTERM system TPR-repeat lipoprotein [Fuerstiella marisgermanici]
MSHDPYSPCVCGSGKKLKFCCQDILSEMIRVEKLVESQPDAAEKLLRSLMTKHQDKEIVVTQLSAILMRKGNYTEAREQLVEFLRRHPDEPRALLALADVCLATEGFAASKRIVHRAFQLGARQYPNSVSMLATRIAGQMAQRGCAMAVREHLALAVRMSEGERRNSLLMQLANFESQRTIPFPFRGRLALLKAELGEEQQKEELRARRVSQLGCWEPAAILYTRLIEQQPNNGALWHNLGLCQAWDGRIEEAAKALHKAADLIEDYDTAVETETLAQLLDFDIAGDDSYGVVQQTIKVTSLSQLLTVLDADSRFARVQSSDDEAARDDGRVVAEYELLTHDIPEDGDLDSIPDVVADITIVEPEGADGGEPGALIVALDTDIDAALAAFRDVCGELALASDDDDKPVKLSQMPQICRAFDWKIHHADEIGASQYRTLNKNRLTTALSDWLDQPMKALNDESPAEAAKDANNLVQIGAAVLSLEVICNRMGYDPDLSDVRSRLGIPSPKPLEIDEQQSITSLPPIQFGRVTMSELTDEQVIDFVNRVTLLRHQLLLEQAIEELIGRPEALDKFPAMRAHLLRASVARENNDLALASQCFADAREAVEDAPDAFRTKLELDIRELSCRLDDPSDPELSKLLGALRDRYFLKIPEIEDVIREELANSGCSHLLDELEAAPAGAGEGGVWTPGAEKPAGEASKLWVPGQD